MRRPSNVELMLLTTILLWALNLSVTKYVLENGLEPLSYASLRYALAGVIFVALALVAERTLRIERRHAGDRRGGSASCSGSTRCASSSRSTPRRASTIGLLIGTIPIFAALFGVALGHERLGSRFWAAAAISSVGVALVAAGSSGSVSGGYRGIALGLVTAATWAGYSVAVDAADADLLALARQRDRDPERLGADRPRRASDDDRAGLGRRLVRSGSCSSSRRSGRS